MDSIYGRRQNEKGLRGKEGNLFWVFFDFLEGREPCADDAIR